MAKDFDSWNSLKKGINQDSRFFDFHEREIWWISCGINIGIEIDGKHSSFERPCIILRKFNRHMAWVLPTTSQIKDDMFHSPFSFDHRVYRAALTQLKTVDSKRLLRKAGMISASEFSEIRSRVAGFLQMNEDPR